jgi:hypothetical protein
MKTRRIILIAVLAQLLALTTFAQKILIDSDKSANFSKFKTYAWKAGTPAPNPLMNDRIIAAIDMQMAAKGLLKVDVEKMPDLIVVYHAAVQYETQLTTMGWYYGGMGTTYVDKIPVGTLLVEMGDPSTKKMVWRGTGSDTVSEKPEKIEKKINQVVEKMFKKFPPEKN